MAKKKSGAWRQWYDPTATDEDYARWREEHRKRALQEVAGLIREAATRNGSAHAHARETGLSDATIARYRKKPIGPRGPSLLTYLLMRRY